MVLIYMLFFIQIFYFSFVNLIDFCFFVFFLVPIFLPRFLSFFCERDKTTPIGINILIFFYGSYVLTDFRFSFCCFLYTSFHFKLHIWELFNMF
jgi:hypothetical protein